MSSLRANVDVILDVRVTEPEAAPAELAEDTVLDALFTTTTVLPPHPRERAKRHGSRESEDVCSRKKERTEMKDARRDSLIDEEAR